MAVSLRDSLLAVDVGSATTRAMLFDVVDGRYRFIATGQASSTAHAPFKDITEGVRQAIENLQNVTGKKLIDADRQMITSAQADGSGVDSFIASFSAGPALKIVVAALLEDVSLASAERLAESTYGHIVERISLNDTRSAQDQMDAIVRVSPDLIIIAGGADDGATKSLKEILEVIGLACYLMPQDKRPAILFVGNQAMEAEVRTSLEAITNSVHSASNIRPSVETEDLRPARKELAQVVTNIRKQQLRGIDKLAMWAGGELHPSIFAEGRMLQFLGKLYGEGKAILSVNLGASATTVSAAFGDQLSSSVYPHLGMGAGLADLEKHTTLKNITRWLPIDIDPQSLTDYLYQKALYPTSVPATIDDLHIEQALAREVLRLALLQARSNFPAKAPILQEDLLPLFEIILAGGGVISNAPTMGQGLLLLLDAVQPVGVSTIILDQNNLLPVLGAAATHNTILPVQVLETGAFVNLATAVSPVSSAKYGTAILRARIQQADGVEKSVELKQGGFEVLSLPIGKRAKLILQPLQRADIGLGSGKRTSLEVNGSALGIVFDGRGRSLNIPEDAVRRRELTKKWLWTVGG